MGHPAAEHVPSSVEALTPAPRLHAVSEPSYEPPALQPGEPPVFEQQRAIEQSFSEAEPDEAYEAEEAYEPEQDEAFVAEPEPEPQPEEAFEAEPEVAFEAESEVTVEPEPEPEPELEATFEPEPEVAVEPEPEPEPEPEAAFEREPEVAVEPEPEPEPVRAAPEPAPVVSISNRRLPAPRGKAAFTLRLDPDRHLQLRLACAVTRRSAQQLVTGALDEFLNSLPEVQALAERVPAGAGRGR
ncbi:MAG TPA: hypothetical protein VGC56_18545 [Allosphingosinicella sp.]